jgi:hypothetical protein
MKNNKILVAQFYTANVSYGKFAEEINKKYCEEKGYEYYCEKDTQKIQKVLGDRAATWYKPKLILEVLNTHNPDYVLFMDIDAIISDTNQEIESFIDPEYDLIFTEDVSHHSIANAGVFILKNTEWAKKFLTAWWNSAEEYAGKDSRDLIILEQNVDKIGYFKNALWHDQTCLTILYDNSEEIRNHIKIISNKSLNHSEYNKGNFIFHAFAYGLLPNRTLDVIYRERIGTDPNKKFINLIVYHIYCVGDYLEVVQKQLARLKKSGLYDWCDRFEVTCIDLDGNFKFVKKLLKNFPKANLNKFTENTYEYQGINKVWEYSQNYSGKVFYFHTKGVSNKYKFKNSNEESEWKKKGVEWWKEAMEYFLIDHYKDCIYNLDKYDQCGLTSNNKWWWGNFWWANLHWVACNEQPTQGDRWYYEAWLNNFRDPFCYEYYHFEFNPYYTVLPKDIYYNKEAYKNSKIELLQAFYGILGEQQDEGKKVTERTMIDVTEQIELNLKVHNFKGFNIRVDNNIAGDPCYGIEKVLEVHFLLNEQKCIIVVDENRNLNFSI